MKYEGERINVTLGHVILTFKLFLIPLGIFLFLFQPILLYINIILVMLAFTWYMTPIVSVTVNT